MMSFLNAELLILLTSAARVVRRIKPPDVNLTSVRPGRLAAGEQPLRVGLRVFNPNPLPVLSMTYRL
jgi:LEA14-like dessication related protein